MWDRFLDIVYRICYDSCQMKDPLTRPEQENGEAEARPEIQQPGPGQESVWDYPTPPRWEDCFKHVQVVYNGVVIADSRQCVRLLETGHPPIFYLPPEDVLKSCLERSERATQSKFLGEARYYDVSVGEKRAANAAWCYPKPKAPYERIKSYVAFYANLMDACMVDGEIVQPQLGGYYGGWITGDVVGPFKGTPGAENRLDPPQR